MRRYLIPALVAANIALAAGLAWLWVTPQGHLRGVRWVPPAPIKPILTDSVLPPWSADLGSFMAALDRPLFAATRRPPPKPEEAAAAVADTLSDVRVLGVYSSGGGAGGAIVRAEGKVRRVRPGDTLGGWTVKEIQPRELVMARGAEKRSLDVKLGPDPGPDVSAAAGTAPVGNQNSSTTTAQQRMQRAQQDADASTAAVNALRARSGMPPLP